MKKDTHFQKCSLLEYLVIISGFAMLIFLVFHPEPRHYLESLGVPGEALLNLHENHHKTLYNVLFVTFVIHIMETLYCIKVAIGLNMTGYTVVKWAFQTFILGLLSLLRIGSHKKSKKSYKNK